MKKTGKHSRRRRKNIAAWGLIISVEVAIATAAGGTVVAVVGRIARNARGYDAFGAEWLIAAAVFIGTYSLIHKAVCDKIFKEGKHG